MDAIRAFAILTVVFAHSSGLLAPLVHNRYIGTAVQAVLAHTDVPGILGVELFFVLSGFLIGTILIHSFVTEGEFSLAVLKKFRLRRWYRTLPLYWLILTTDILLFKVIGLQKIEPYKLLFYPFIQNLWYPNPRWFFGEAWSLSVEEWFYITLPLALYLCTRVFRPVNKQAFLVKVFTGYLSLFAIIRLVYALYAPADLSQDEGIRKVVLFRLDAVMYGVLMAAFCYFRQEAAVKMRGFLLVFMLLSYPLFWWLMASPDIHLTAPATHTLQVISNAFTYMLIPLLFSLCLPYAATRSSTGNGIVTRTIRHISKISYAMYLTHYSLIYLPFFSFLHISSGTSATLLYLLYWSVVIGLSSLLYYLFESPILRYRDRVIPG